MTSEAVRVCECGHAESDHNTLPPGRPRLSGERGKFDCSVCTCMRFVAVKQWTPISGHLSAFGSAHFQLGRPQEFQIEIESPPMFVESLVSNVSVSSVWMLHTLDLDGVGLLPPAKPYDFPIGQTYNRNTQRWENETVRTAEPCLNLGLFYSSAYSSPRLPGLPRKAPSTKAVLKGVYGGHVLPGWATGAYFLVCVHLSGQWAEAIR